MIKVLFRNSSSFSQLSPREFAERMDLLWLDSLRFDSKKTIQKVLLQSKKAIKKKQLSIREKWLGIRYQMEISEGFSPNIAIRWISEDLGYGVFAEQNFPLGTFIGEYTGFVRKRSKRKDKKNNYCFEYTIGDWVYNPFIIDAEKQGNFTRFINHNDIPNLEPFSVYVDEIMHIILVTAKPIQKGEQLCYHYGDTFWKKCRHPKRRLIDF